MVLFIRFISCFSVSFHEELLVLCDCVGLITQVRVMVAVATQKIHQLPIRTPQCN